MKKRKKEEEEEEEAEETKKKKTTISRKWFWGKQGQSPLKLQGNGLFGSLGLHTSLLIQAVSVLLVSWFFVFLLSFFRFLDSSFFCLDSVCLAQTRWAPINNKTGQQKRGKKGPRFCNGEAICCMGIVHPTRSVLQSWGSQEPKCTNGRPVLACFCQICWGSFFCPDLWKD